MSTGAANMYASRMGENPGAISLRQHLREVHVLLRDKGTCAFLDDWDAWIRDQRYGRLGPPARLSLNHSTFCIELPTKLTLPRLRLRRTTRRAQTMGAGMSSNVSSEA